MSKLFHSGPFVFLFNINNLKRVRNCRESFLNFILLQCLFKLNLILAGSNWYWSLILNIHWICKNTLSPIISLVSQMPSWNLNFKVLGTKFWYFSWRSIFLEWFKKLWVHLIYQTIKLNMKVLLIMFLVMMINTDLCWP